MPSLALFVPALPVPRAPSSSPGRRRTSGPPRRLRPPSSRSHCDDQYRPYSQSHFTHHVTPFASSRRTATKVSTNPATSMTSSDSPKSSKSAASTGTAEAPPLPETSPRHAPSSSSSVSSTPSSHSITSLPSDSATPSDPGLAFTPPPSSSSPSPQLIALAVGMAAAAGAAAGARFASGGALETLLPFLFTHGTGSIPDVINVADVDAAAAAKAAGGAPWLDIGALASAIVRDPHFFATAGLGLSAFVQTLTGFGFAIVGVGTLSQIPWIVHSSVFEDVQPIAATLSGGIAWALLATELDKVEWRRVMPCIIASTLAAPLGAAGVRFIDAALALKGLGAVIMGYALFSLSNAKVPKSFGSKKGAWIFGGVAGLFGGAFDITGPPLVVHGQAAGWGDSFRRNLLAVVAVNSTVVFLLDLFEGRMNSFYYYDLLKYAIPGCIVGTVAGNLISKRLDPSGFKKVVLATCILMGGRLFFS